MTDLKHIAATLAVLGTAAFAMTGCKKESTEAPGGGGAAAGEKSCRGQGGCGGHKGGDEAKGDGGDEAKEDGGDE